MLILAPNSTSLPLLFLETIGSPASSNQVHQPMGECSGNCLSRRMALLPCQFTAGQKLLPPVLLEGRKGLPQQRSTRSIESQDALQVAELSSSPLQALICAQLGLCSAWRFVRKLKRSFSRSVWGRGASKNLVGLMAKIIEYLFSAIPRLVEHLQIVGLGDVMQGCQESSS